MSIRNLDALFKPKSVALIGASHRPHSVGALVAKNLLAQGFDGVVMPVNPKHQSIDGVLCYPDVKSLPVAPDLAVICTPAATVPGLVGDLSTVGTKGVIVISAGFAEGDDKHGKELTAQMLRAARPTLMRIVGPNCIGVISTPAHLNASFAHVPPLEGNVAFVSQSGAILTTVLDWAVARGVGFSHLVSLGDMSDVDFGDMLDYLALDPSTNAILLYVEAITHARKFMSAARAASRTKPVVVIKSGRGAGGAKAAASHTGAMAGADDVYDAAFERTGIVRVQDLDELFDALETLAIRPPMRGERLAIVTNGGGAGVLAADALALQGGQLAALSQQTIANLDARLPPTWSHGNPVDIIGDADGERYAAVLDTLSVAPEVDGVLAINCPTAVTSEIDAAKAVVDVAGKRKMTLLTNWLGSGAARDSRKLFVHAQIPSYDTPEDAVRGFMHLVHYRRAQAALMEVPPSIPADFDPDRTHAEEIIAGALAAGRTWLGPQDVNALLSCYRIPVPRLAIAPDANAAATIAKEFATPVAVKIFSPDIVHKSDVGGVALSLTAETVAAAVEAMKSRISKTAPAARIGGFVVQEMISRPKAYELILGITQDAQFGPVLLFGHGGTAAEIINDKALGFPPLNLNLAAQMIRSTQIHKELTGYRDEPRANLDAIAFTLVKLSQLVCDLDDVAEVDINPLLADAAGVIAVDARIRVAHVSDKKPGARLAIQPYPSELEQSVEVDGFGRLTIRPIEPEDALILRQYFSALTPEDRRMRFFCAIADLSPSLVARFTQIDYDREMALIVLNAASDILGVARIAADPDNEMAEFAISVRSDLQGRGLGKLLMQRMMDCARKRGIGSLVGYVLQDNQSMLELARQMGFAISSPNTDGIVCASLKLA